MEFKKKKIVRHSLFETPNAKGEKGMSKLGRIFFLAGFNFCSLIVLYK